ncbi:MAG TPA: glycoside hydrolase family 3 C-terminal domain-containing protein [Candidatus Baltobacteraceae bacterium]
MADLVARLTLAEKVALLNANWPAIPRLDMPSYGWWNEALHGVARAGVATVFPQAIALSATWDQPLAKEVAGATSIEARAIYNRDRTKDAVPQWHGITFFTPNINIARDPRWGRVQETYGEDPWLTASMATAFVQGLQGDDSEHLRTAATLKHFVAHSGPESGRVFFDAQVDAHDLNATYMRQFRLVAQAAQPALFMASYNKLNGVPMQTNRHLLTDVLRKEWGFSGFIVSDCLAIRYLWRDVHAQVDAAHAAAAALGAGVDMSCWDDLLPLVQARNEGLVTDAAIDRSLGRVLDTAFRLGMFDPVGSGPYDGLAPSEIDSAQHRALALKAAEESVALLKNGAGALPLTYPSVRRVAVIGPTANSVDVLLGNYNGTPSSYTTILSGVRDVAAGLGINVSYIAGCALDGSPTVPQYADAVALAKKADAVIVVAGYSPKLEGEEGEGGDRSSLALPGHQADLLAAVASAGKPVILVLTGGSAISLADDDANANAILMSWYSGEEGGNAVAQTIFGFNNPAGRLPLTFYQSVDQLPALSDYDMRERTYRYFDGAPWRAFGFGLSFTTFRYANLQTAPGCALGASCSLTIDVTNTGQSAGDDVVEAYLKKPASKRNPLPELRELAGFARIALLPGQTETVQVSVAPDAFSQVAADGSSFRVSGSYDLAVGGTQPSADWTYPSEQDGILEKLQVLVRK